MVETSSGGVGEKTSGEGECDEITQLGRLNVNLWSERMDQKTFICDVQSQLSVSCGRCCKPVKIV